MYKIMLSFVILLGVDRDYACAVFKEHIIRYYLFSLKENVFVQK